MSALSSPPGRRRTAVFGNGKGQSKDMPMTPDNDALLAFTHIRAENMQVREEEAQTPTLAPVSRSARPPQRPHTAAISSVDGPIFALRWC
jgi:hypothetical protein